MGNYQIKETINKHQELREQIVNNKLNQNLIIFNIPIVIETYRGSKSFIEQMVGANEEELNNTTYNELYLSELKIKITNDDIHFVKNNELTNSWTPGGTPGGSIEVLQTYDEKGNYIRIYKHFDWDDEPVPEIISTHIENIIKLQDQIKTLKSQIWEEKTKIRGLDYVQSKLNKPVGKTNEYIRTVKYLYESLLTR
jgi:hypothetical protein